MIDVSATEEQLTSLGERLAGVLDKEFAALTEKNIFVLEDLQLEKIDLLSQIEALWQASKASVGDQHELFEKSKQAIEECRDRHIRNEILLGKQIEQVKALLATLTTQSSNNFTNVYDKLGKLNK